MTTCRSKYRRHCGLARHARAPKPNWEAMCVSFEGYQALSSHEIDVEFYDPNHTWWDDGWVDDIPPHSSDDGPSYDFMNPRSSNEDEAFWWAFVHSYYASASDLESVINADSKFYRKPKNEFKTRPPNILQPPSGPPSSTASNNLVRKNDDDSPLSK
ncbi:UNVERIFIED_CONTAM: hypothetical protein Sradi_5240800 [Sesamum radiatum]|uniref:Uncharacterized protein n=1 Tax=Sesamum radiatum TaxID=300843 RepID=A0AAW2LND2_SESRA